MTTAALPAGIADSPEWLPQAMDVGSNLVRLVQMDAAAYRAASFLDDRLFQHPVTTMLCDWRALLGSIGSGRRHDARWIFHIGHVGSTLISRLLGELPRVLAIREPRILRDITILPEDAAHRASTAMTGLLSRSFAPTDVALVKATSFVSEIAPRLCPPGERALFLFATPTNYIRSILAGENSRKELALLAGARGRRMAGRVKLVLPPGAHDAHLAAAAWACEMTALEASADAMSDRSIRWADFDAMLDDLAIALGATARHFGFAADPSTIAAVAAGPLMSRYSKALEFDYSPALRRDLLSEAGRDHARAIEAALTMLHKAADQSPLLARALTRTTTES